ncbi:MAG: hypothetical protein MJZ64_03650 [Paludibacteraceae bacterium]|nr:hypothetical protein [Paludibacteraceae bacterium]
MKNFPQPPECVWGNFTEQRLHPHQRMIGSKKLAVVNDAIKQMVETHKSYATFEDLFNDVASVCVGLVCSSKYTIRNINNLLIYDIAKRMALHYDVTPSEYVYVHKPTFTTTKKPNGPYGGAVNLGLNVVPLNGINVVKRAEIIARYPELEPLSSAEIEDFLCIYCHELSKYKHS